MDLQPSERTSQRHSGHLVEVWIKLWMAALVDRGSFNDFRICQALMFDLIIEALEQLPPFITAPN